MSGETFPWADDWIGIMKMVLGIQGDIEEIVLTFRTGQYAQVIIVWRDGKIESRSLAEKGILKVRELMKLPHMAQRITFRMKQGGWVTGEYQFIFQDAMASDIALCAVEERMAHGQQ
jgi:hypothetical protein